MTILKSLLIVVFASLIVAACANAPDTPVATAPAVQPTLPPAAAPPPPTAQPPAAVAKQTAAKASATAPAAAKAAAVKNVAVADTPPSFDPTPAPPPVATTRPVDPPAAIVDKPAVALAPSEASTPAALSSAPSPRAPSRPPAGKIASILVDKLTLFDADGRQIGATNRDAVSIPSGGLPYFGRKGMFIETEVNNQLVWIRETQVALLDERAAPLQRERSRSPTTGIKSVSPGLSN